MNYKKTQCLTVLTSHKNESGPLIKFVVTFKHIYMLTTMYSSF